MSIGHRDDELAQLLDSATTPLPPPDFEQRVMRRLRRQRRLRPQRTSESSHTASAALNRLLQHATQPTPPPDFARRVIEKLNLRSPQETSTLARRLTNAARRYHLLSWARAACLLLATVLACLLRGRPEHTPVPSQASESPSLWQSVEESMTLGEDSLLTEAFNSLDDAEVVAALCAVSTRSSTHQSSIHPRSGSSDNSR